MVEVVPFRAALRFGEEGERLVRDLLGAAGWWVNERAFRASRDLSVLVRGQEPVSVEVKREDNKAGTGNLCLELYQGKPRRPSGLSTSESTVVVHTLGERAALYRTQSMRLYVKSALQEERYKVRSFGDNHNQGVILPIRDVAKEEWFDHLPMPQLASSRVWAWRAA